MIKNSELYWLNLIGKPYSKQLRMEVGEKLGIGLNNGKTLLNKLNMFGISIEEIQEILRK